MISADGKAAVIEVDMQTGGYMDATNDAVVALRADIRRRASAPKPPSGLTVNITGDAPLGQEYIET